MIQSRGGRHWCPLFGSEHVHGSRSSGRAVGTAAGASARSARMTRASRLKRARLSKRTVMVPHRYPAKTLPTRSDTDSPAPRSSSMRALDASAALATRARSIAAPTPCPPRREARRPGRYAPRRRRRAERSARDLGRCAKKANEEKRRRNVDASFRVRACGGRLSRAPANFARLGVFDLFPKAERVEHYSPIHHNLNARRNGAPLLLPTRARSRRAPLPAHARERHFRSLRPRGRASCPRFRATAPSRAENDHTNPVRIAKSRNDR